MGAFKNDEQMNFDFNSVIESEITEEETSESGMAEVLNFSPKFSIVAGPDHLTNKVHSPQDIESLAFQFDYNAIEILYREIGSRNKKARFSESVRNNYSRHRVASGFMTPEYFEEVHAFSLTKVIEKFEVSRMVAMARIICERRENGLIELDSVRAMNDLELERIGVFLAGQKKKAEEIPDMSGFFKYYTKVFGSLVMQYYRSRVGRAVTIAKEESKLQIRDTFMEDSNSENVEDRLISRDSIATIMEAIGRESDPNLVMKALQLYIIEGYTMEEASDALTISKGKFQRCVEKIEHILVEINPDYVREAERRGRNKKESKPKLRLLRSEIETECEERVENDDFDFNDNCYEDAA